MQTSLGFKNSRALSVFHVNTLHAAIVSPSKQNRIVSQNFWNFTNFLTNTRHVWTNLNAFLMVIPNIVTKFQNFDIFEHFLTFCYCRLLPPAAWKGLTLCTREASASRRQDSRKYQKYQHSWIWWLYLKPPWEIHSNESKHAWYLLRYLWNVENFEKTKRFCV